MKNIEKCKLNDINISFISGEKNEINDLINKIETFGKIIPCNKYINSLIIKNNFECINLIKSWINPNKEIKTELLYRLSKDGENILKFHELCDNKGPTLTIFSEENGNSCGIYTPLSWDMKSRTKKDNETFMFNLNKKEKYEKLNKNEVSIWCLDCFGPWTNYFGFIKTMKIIEHRGIDINSIYKNGAEILPNNTYNTKNFNIKEVEVYKVLIEDNK